MRYRLSHRRYSLPFKAPVRTAHGPWAAREGVLVRLEDAAGRARVGEAAPLPWFGTETVDDILAALERLGPDATPEQLAAVPAKLGCLRFALAAATSDAPKPVREHLPVAALLPAGRGAIALAGAKAEAGFRTFKWKVGVAAVDEELAMLDDLVAALPEGSRLRLDANGAWDRRQAERWLALASDRPVEFVEQPVARDTRGAEDVLVGLASDYPVKLALDESLYGTGEVERWLGVGWSGVWVVKPALLGDPAGALARLAKAGADVVFSSALETAAGARASLGAAFAWPGHAKQPRALGFGVWPLFADGRCDGPAAAPFIRASDVERINPEAVWNALG